MVVSQIGQTLINVQLAVEEDIKRVQEVVIILLQLMVVKTVLETLKKLRNVESNLAQVSGRSSHPDVFLGKGFLKICSKFSLIITSGGVFKTLFYFCLLQDCKIVLFRTELFIYALRDTDHVSYKLFKSRGLNNKFRRPCQISIIEFSTKIIISIADA